MLCDPNVACVAIFFYPFPGSLCYCIVPDLWRDLHAEIGGQNRHMAKFGTGNVFFPNHSHTANKQGPLF